MSGTRKPRQPLVADRRYPKKTSTQKTKQKPAPKRKPTKKRGLLGWIFAPFTWALRLIWRMTWRLSAVVAVLIAVGVFFFAAQLPPVDKMVDGRVRGSVTLLDRDGDIFALRGDQYGGFITAETVSPHLKNAVIASEDKRFYWHPGVDPRGIASAVRINLREGRGPLSGNGGSTLTQQTAKLLCLGVKYDPTVWKNEAEYEADCRRTTVWRKVKEAIYAMAMEFKYSKDDILTIYLNRAFLGSGNHGFEAASQRFFGKSATDLLPQEAAMLSGILPAPSRLAPTNNLERAQERGDLVLRLMEDQGYLTEAETAQARANPATLSEQATARIGGYFADWVMDNGPGFFTRDTTEDVIIQTTLDQRIQAATEEALLWVFENKVSESSVAEAAVVVMSADGAVRAMVGGRNVKAIGAFNRATQARRQTGSVFKPFIYGTALELGFSPYDLVDDSPIVINVPGSGPWEPQNYDREFKGPITLNQAMAESRNIPAVIMNEEVGRKIVRNVAQGFGIESGIAAGPAMALGVSESTLIEMTGAYAGFLNGGSAVTPYGLVNLHVRGDQEPLMDNSTLGIQERVIREEAARQLTWMMMNVVEGGTGRRAKLDGWQVAAKTGTTQSSRDAWFIGFTGDYVTGVWMGNDDNTPLRDVTGGGLPADIWRETMVRVTDGMTPSPLPFSVPPNATTGQIVQENEFEASDEIKSILEGLLVGN